MSDAAVSIGAELQRGSADSSGATFTKVGEITRISHTRRRGTVEVTHLGLTHREFKTGFRDIGEITAHINFVNSDWDNLMTDYNEDNDWYYKIVLPDTSTSTWLFSGLITDLTLDIPEEDAIGCDITIKLTGQDQMLT